MPVWSFLCEDRVSEGTDIRTAGSTKEDDVGGFLRYGEEELALPAELEQLAG